MSARLVALCPAKINLGLKILRRRDDGFHAIATVFQAIDLTDRLEAVESDDVSLDCDDPSIPRDDRNLVVRAARLLQERVPVARGRGASLSLHKAIPAGAGLGGGSSDAAGALLLLAALWRIELDDASRHALAAALGSDVPFFLRGGRALGEGRGEVLTSLPAGPERAVLLGTPPEPLATAAVYAASGAALTPSAPDVTVTRFLVKLAEGNDFARAENDLERAAFAMRPELAAFKDALSRTGARPALLCGSGSSVFGMYASVEETERIAPGIRAEFPDWTVRLARTTGLGARVTS